MNILGPLAAGLALTPLASKSLDRLSDKLSFASLLAPEPDPVASDDAQPDSLAGEKLEALRRKLAARLLVAGIDLSQPVELGFSLNGQIEVRSAHLQAFEIEQLLNRDAESKREFLEVAEQLNAEEFVIELGAS
jgi:hypothetical protein